MAKSSSKSVECIPLKSMRAWLKGTVDGRKLLADEVSKALKEATDERCRACKASRRIGVLIVMDSTGAIEVYCHPRINIHVGHRLDTNDIELQESYLESTLPKWAKEMFWPVNLRTRDVPIKRTVEQEKERLLDVEILNGLQQFKEENEIVIPF